MENVKRIVVGICGASGAALGIKALQLLRQMAGVKVHLVLSAAFKAHLSCESPLPFEELNALADFYHDEHDLGAPIASGSFKTDGMIVIPCSMKTLGGLAAGYSDNLLLRAGDVHLKERRSLVLVTRESPLNLIHIRNMETLTLAGAVIMPPVVTFYHQPHTLDDMTTQIAARALNQLGLDVPEMSVWRSG